jgi:hypothetical protein
MAHNSCVHTERAHVGILRELLQVVAELLGKHWDWDEITILELELSSCVSEPGDNELSILHVAYDDSSDIVIDAENVSD